MIIKNLSGGSIMSRNTDFFLGANTPKGFVSFFDELYNPYTDVGTYIIKGGPGTGKSTLMKRLADRLDEKGIPCEKVHCASDPESLDGLISPEAGLCLADGTSPHVIEPRFPGAAENIINLGRFWDESVLRRKRERIISLTVENSLYHRRSAAYLSAAGKLERETALLSDRYVIEEKAEAFAKRFAQRETPRKKKCSPGRRYRRFASAITPKGEILFHESFSALATRIFALDDKWGQAGKLICEKIGDKAVANGYDVIFCYSPLDSTRSEHIIIPEVNVALVSLKKDFTALPGFCRTVHCGRFMRPTIENNRQVLRFNSRLKAELIKEAVKKLSAAKQVHDRLEAEYRAAMDFDALTEYSVNFINKITADI